MFQAYSSTGLGLLPGKKIADTIRPMSTGIKTALLSLYVYNNNGVRFLASTLRKSGHEVTEIYFKDYVYHHFVPPTEEEYRLLVDLIKKQNIGLLGISMRAGAYTPVAKEITRRVDALRDMLIGAEKERKIFEKLDEKDREEFYRDVYKKEQAFLDEVGVNRFVQRTAHGRFHTNQQH